MIPAFLSIFQAYFHFESKYLVQLTLGTAMACMVVNASCATLAQNRKKSVCWQVPARHWPLLCIGTMAGVALTAYAAAELIKACFGLYCIHSGYRMVTRKYLEPVFRPAGANRLVVLLFSLLCGFTGTGGANLFVPYLTRIVGLDLRTAMGTASAIQIPVAIVGAASFMAMGLLSQSPFIPGDGKAIGYIYLPAFLLVSVVGPYFSVAGVAVAHRLPATRLKLIFGAFTLFIGFKMVHSAVSV